MEETRATRVQTLQRALRPWQRQHDLLLRYVLTRVIEVDRLGELWPLVPVATMTESRP